VRSGGRFFGEGAILGEMCDRAIGRSGDRAIGKWAIGRSGDREMGDREMGDRA